MLGPWARSQGVSSSSGTASGVPNRAAGPLALGPWSAVSCGIGVAEGAPLGPWQPPPVSSAVKRQRQQGAVAIEAACVVDTPAGLRGEARLTKKAAQAQDEKHIRPEFRLASFCVYRLLASRASVSERFCLYHVRYMV